MKVRARDDNPGKRLWISKILEQRENRHPYGQQQLAQIFGAKSTQTNYL